MLLEACDELLFCGRPEAERRMAWALANIDVMSYLLTGVERPGGWIWRLLEQRRHLVER